MSSSTFPSNGDLRQLAAEQTEGARRLSQLIKDTRLVVQETETLLANPIWTPLDSVEAGRNESAVREIPLADRAAAVLRRALASPIGAERRLLMDEALRLHRLAVAQEVGELAPKEEVSVP